MKNALLNNKIDLKNIEIDKSRSVLDEFNDFHLSLRKEELMFFLKTYNSRLKKYAQKYFGVSDKKTEEDLQILVDYLSTIRNFRSTLEDHYYEIEQVSLFEYSFALFYGYFEDIQEELSDDAINQVMDEMSYYFIYALAYYIYQDYDRNIRESIMNDFLELMNEFDACKENYLKINSIEYNNAPYIEPDAKFACPIIMAVLMEMDNRSIQRKIKKIIYKYSKENYKKLGEINKKQDQLFRKYEQGIDRRKYMREFAFVFLMDYFEDRMFLAPYSPFVRLMDEEIISLMDENSIFMERLMKDIVREKYESSIKDTIDIIKKRDESIIDYVEEASDYFSNLFMVSQKSYFPLIGESFEEQLLNEYYDKIVEACCLIEDSSIYDQEDFIGLSDKDKVVFIMTQAYEFFLMDKLKISEDYINRTVDVNSAKILSVKDKEIEARDEVIRTLKKQLDDKNQEIVNIQSKYKSAITERVEKNSKAYKKDIADLNKQLAKKDEQIQQLMEEQEELHKLRELMFALDVEENEIIPNQQQSLTDLSKKFNIVFVGGHEHLQKYMKNTFPNLTYLIGDSEGFDDRIIAKADYVFFCYKHMNHGVYQKVMKTIVAENIKFDYVSTTNVNRLENEIVTKIEQGGKTRK